MPHSKERSDELILRSYPVCARAQRAQCTFQFTYHSFRAAAHLSHFSEKNIFFCSGSVCLFFAGGETAQLTRYTH